ncbi:hypothetical protein [Vulcanococcus sp.]|uniref:hypothetical protein n=1 Tax=Vulcanococcus sp. TaxID=2856995 RepID=UPI003C0924DB
MTRTPWKRGEHREFTAAGPWLSVTACLVTLLIIWVPIALQTTKALGCNPEHSWMSICRW